MIPELLALVMTLALVVLEQWVWAGMGMEKPVDEISEQCCTNDISPPCTQLAS